MRRHRQTAEGVAAAFAAQGQPLPEPMADPGFAEFDHEAVFGAYHARAIPSTRSSWPAAAASRATSALMLQAALLAWARDELPGLPETWAAFGQRVRSAGDRLEALAGDDEVLVLSSGGVISRLAQIALEVPDTRAVELNLSLRNRHCRNSIRTAAGCAWGRGTRCRICTANARCGRTIDAVASAHVFENPMTTDTLRQPVSLFRTLARTAGRGRALRRRQDHSGRSRIPGACGRSADALDDSAAAGIAEGRGESRRACGTCFCRMPRTARA